MKLPWSSFVTESRANKLSRYQIKSRKSGEVIVLRGASETASSVELAANGACRIGRFKDEFQTEWTHALIFDHGVPEPIVDTLELLKESLTLRQIDGVDIAHALDWYKRENDEGELEPTDTGRRINYTKYAPYPNGGSSRQARAELHDAMVDFLERHPVFADAEWITAPPGHAADGASYAEKLSQALATRTGKTFVPMSAPGPREEQKASESRQLEEIFELEDEVSGTIVIIDDVCHSGATLSAAADACRRAGASTVAALVAARTMRR